MATNSAINTSNPISVASGGTGVSSATAYAVLCGGTTSTASFQSVASVGTSGQVLVSNGASALPTFQTVAVTNSLFAADNTATQNDITGDGTVYQVAFNSEIFDVGNNFASNTFTAPSTGKYFFTSTLSLVIPSSSFNNMNLLLVTSNRNWSGNMFHPGNARAGNTGLNPIIACIADMDAADTAYISISVSGSTKTVDLYDDTNANTFFCGQLIPSI